MFNDISQNVEISNYPKCPYSLMGWGGTLHGGNLVPFPLKNGETVWKCTHPECPHEVRISETKHKEE